MGGVLIDEISFLTLLYDDVALIKLADDPPGLYLRQGHFLLDFLRDRLPFFGDGRGDFLFCGGWINGWE